MGSKSEGQRKGQEAAPNEELEQVEPQGRVALSMNQVVAFNLMRARRRAGWTQDEAAERLTNAMNKKWTNATLSAAERSWQSGRTREFNADELVAFAEVFDLPVPYFFVPPMPDEVNGSHVSVSVAKSHIADESERRSRVDIFFRVFHFGEETSDRVERVFAKDGLISYRPPAYVWENPGWMRFYQRSTQGQGLPAVTEGKTAHLAATGDASRTIDLAGAPEDIVEAVLSYRRFMWELDMVLTRFRQEQWRLERPNWPDQEPPVDDVPKQPGVEQSPDDAPHLYRADDMVSDQAVKGDED